MTTEEAFLLAIRERPDESTWLVHGDWLEDPGEPLGELIRAHIEMEKLPRWGPRSRLEARPSWPV